MTVVIKIGGSLLMLPDLVPRLRFVLHQRSDQRCLIVVGGGAMANVVRDWSQVHSLSDEMAHWLAISSMRLNQELLAGLLGLAAIRSREEADVAWKKSPASLLLDMSTFAIREEAGASHLLPHSWDVTSDSLACWVAARWPADELVLVKSVACPVGLSAIDASERDLVDRYFPSLADAIPRITWCDLRSSEMSIEPWL